jgi:hypothetical protein
MVVYLLLDEAWDINAQTFAVAGGHVGLLPQLYPPMKNIFKEGTWSLDELRRVVPAQLMAGVENAAPPRPDIEVPGRD